MSNHGNVYVIHAIGTNHYKIGITKRNVEDRLRELQTGNPVKLEVVRCYWVDDMELCETELHNAFAHCHVNGEWFEIDTPFIVDSEIQKIESFATDYLGNYVLRPNGAIAVSDRFNFCLGMMSNSSLGFFGKFVMFWWSLFVKLEPKIEPVSVSPMEAKQRNHEWYVVPDFVDVTILE